MNCFLLENVSDDIHGILENKDKESNTRQMCLCTGVLSNLNELILRMDLGAAIVQAVSSRFYCPKRVWDKFSAARHKHGFAESHNII